MWFSLGATCELVKVESPSLGVRGGTQTADTPRPLSRLLPPRHGDLRVRLTFATAKITKNIPLSAHLNLTKYVRVH